MNEALLAAKPANILVVDDTPANLHVLSSMLKERGYKVRPVPSGKLALQAALRDPPDLILLDIMMPEMDGYEVCTLLKESESLRDIPVIFISALNETVDKVKAFSTGGVDYVTKPFQLEEVQARVKAHLELRRQQCLLRENYEQLRKLEELRDNLVHMIVHDMRNPLMVLSAFLKLLEKFEQSNLSQENRDYLPMALESAGRLIKMVNALLDVSKLESGEMKLHRSDCDLGELIRNLIRNQAPFVEERMIKMELPDEPMIVTADAELLARIVQNLLDNALKYTPEDCCITIGVLNRSNVYEVYVQDNGPGIPAEDHERIFEKFGQVSGQKLSARYATGLGLTFCKLAVEAHGGVIGVRSIPDEGSTFWFTLPKPLS